MTNDGQDDLTVVKAEHEGDHFCDGEWAMAGFGHCLPWRLADRAERAEAKVRAVEALRKRYRFLGGDWLGFADDLDAALAALDIS